MKIDAWKCDRCGKMITDATQIVQVCICLERESSTPEYYNRDLCVPCISIKLNTSPRKFNRPALDTLVSILEEKV